MTDRADPVAARSQPQWAIDEPSFEVPCNGCTICCKNDAVRLLPWDDPAQYKTEPHDSIRGALMLAHKPNRDCFYLGAEGCTIHDTKPLMCRRMDCRNIASNLSLLNATRMIGRGKLSMPLWIKAQAMLRDHPPSQQVTSK